MNHLLFYVKENLIPPTYFSLYFFIFLTLHFQISKKFISLFSGTERHTKFKLGPHMDSRLICLLESGCWCLFSPLFLQFSFFSNSKTLKFLSQFSVRPTKLKLDTHMGSGLIYCLHQIQAARRYLLLYFSSFFFLSFQLAKIKNLLLQNCLNIPLMATAGGMWALLTLLYFLHFSFSLIFNIEILHHTFLRNCEA